MSRRSKKKKRFEAMYFTSNYMLKLMNESRKIWETFMGNCQKCFYCDSPFTVNNDRTIDHFYPSSYRENRATEFPPFKIYRESLSVRYNKVWSCMYCNTLKDCSDPYLFYDFAKTYIKPVGWSDNKIERKAVREAYVGYLRQREMYVMMPYNWVDVEYTTNRMYNDGERSLPCYVGNIMKFDRELRQASQKERERYNIHKKRVSAYHAAKRAHRRAIAGNHQQSQVSELQVPSPLYGEVQGCPLPSN